MTAGRLAVGFVAVALFIVLLMLAQHVGELAGHGLQEWMVR